MNEPIIEGFMRIIVFIIFAFNIFCCQFPIFSQDSIYGIYSSSNTDEIIIYSNGKFRLIHDFLMPYSFEENGKVIYGEWNRITDSTLSFSFKDTIRSFEYGNSIVDIFTCTTFSRDGIDYIRVKIKFRGNDYEYNYLHTKTGYFDSNDHLIKEIKFETDSDFTIVNYFPSGKVHLIFEYRNLKLNGNCYVFHENGRLKICQIWKAGRLMEERKFNMNLF